MKIKYILLIALLFCVRFVSAQYVDRGQDPAGIKWKQINTENFQLIFPANCEKSAQYYANVLDVLYRERSSSLDHSPRKVSIIMHTNGGVSNGTVYWAPSSLELFTTPPQDGDFQVWAEHLACHEFRHVVQIDKLNQGMTKFLTYLFGQQATAVVLGAYVPMWFLEGDAVAFETGMTKSGRGRLPRFEQEVRAQLVEKGIYSYDKAVLGSYKDFVPNRYYLGYYMVANARKNYGPEIWQSALNRVGRNPFGVTSFASGINEVLETNRKRVWDSLAPRLAKFDSKFINVESVLRANKKADAKVTLYNDNMTELLAEWWHQDKRYNKKDCADFTPRRKVYTSYRFPHYTTNGGIISLKTGKGEAGSIVEILPGKRERTIFEPGYGVTKIDYYKGKVVWSEYKSSLRWENGGRHIIVQYDMIKKKCKRFKYKYNLFAPCLSDGGKIVTIGNRTDNSVFLAVMEYGKVSKVIDAKENEQFQVPCWINEKEAALVVLDNKGKRIEIINVETGSRRVVLESQMADISGLKYSNGRLLFNASLSGKDELYSLNMDSQRLSVLTESRFGSVDVDINEDNKLIYSTYSADGYCVVEDNYSEKPVAGEYKFKLAETLSKQEKGAKPYSVDKNKKFDTKKYNKTSHLLNFHSWAPMFIDGLEKDTDIGISVASQNMLSTMFVVAGYKNDEDYDSGVGYLNFNFRAWWPLINLKAEYGKVESTSFDFNAKNKTSGDNETVAFTGKRDRLDLEAEIQLPFDISRGKYSRRITPMVEYDYISFSDIAIDMFVRAFEVEEELKFESANPNDYAFENNKLKAKFLSYKLFAYNLKKTAMRDIGYRCGQIVEAGYRHSLDSDADYGYTYYGEGRLYLPGIGRHHNIELYGGYQYFDELTEKGQVFYSKDINSPRGMILYGKQVKTFKGTYNMPLFYPDFNLGSLVYLKRISSGLFYDWGAEEYYFSRDLHGNPVLSERDYFSCGGELKADVNFLRLPAPVNLGARVGYESKTRSVFAKFFLNISFDF